MDNFNDLSDREKEIVTIYQKYCREERITTQKKNQNYQREIDNLFMAIYKNLRN